MTSKFVIALYFIVPVLFLAIFSALISMRGISRFWEVNQVKWMPKGIVFGIAWLILYILMAWGGYQYYTNQTNVDKQLNFLSLFYVQLLFNFLWVLSFFTQPSYTTGRFALMVMLFLFISVVYLIYMSWGVSTTATWFFVIYALWLVFAAILNVAFINDYNKTVLTT